VTAIGRIMNDSPHLPVLYKEIIHALQPKQGGRYVDGTLGAGGHARGILEACAPDGHLLGLDVDPQALAIARKTLAPYEHRIHLAQASYTTLSTQLENLQWDSVDGIVLDLGASSMQFDTPERGFSFMQDAPLDMRFGPYAIQTAADIVNNYAERELADLIYEYGEERDSRKIARAIVGKRPLHTTRTGRSDRSSISPTRRPRTPRNEDFSSASHRGQRGTVLDKDNASSGSGRLAVRWKTRSDLLPFVGRSYRQGIF